MGKTVQINWWRFVGLEDRKTYAYFADVLRPAEMPDDESVRDYVEGLNYAPVLRRQGNLGSNGYFSSEQGRHVLEQEFLKAGVRIRDMCPYLKTYHRPLGYSVLETPGFGSLLVTFRNCPNSAPLLFGSETPGIRCSPGKPTDGQVLPDHNLRSAQLGCFSQDKGTIWRAVKYGIGIPVSGERDSHSHI